MTSSSISANSTKSIDRVPMFLPRFARSGSASRALHGPIDATKPGESEACPPWADNGWRGALGPSLVASADHVLAPGGAPDGV